MTTSPLARASSSVVNSLVSGFCDETTGKMVKFSYVTFPAKRQPFVAGPGLGGNAREVDRRFVAGITSASEMRAIATKIGRTASRLRRIEFLLAARTHR